MASNQETEPREEHVRISTNVGYFSNYIEALERLRDEGKLIFKDGRIFSKVADPANVSMCVSKIEGQALNSFHLENCDSIKAGVKFERVSDCLTGVKNSSELEVTWPVTNGSTNYIRLDAIDEDLQFEISGVALDTIPKSPQSDPLSHPTRIIVGGSDLKKAISNADKMADTDDASVYLETLGDAFQLRTSDKVEGNFKKQFYQSGPAEGKDLGQHKTEISMERIKEISKSLGSGDEVTAHIKDNHPIRFDVKLDDNGDAQVIYIIAPRRESN